MPPRRAVLLTDAHRGVGRATALLLAERGMQVLACAPSLDGLSDLPRETARGGLVEVYATDLSSDAACRAAIERARTLFGHVDTLVHAGGMGRFGAIEETPHATVRDLFDANFFGPLRLIQAMTPVFRAQRRGVILCISSAAGRIAMPLSGAYSASQFALEGLCDALRLELGVFGVDVVLIEPGLVRAGLVTAARPALSAADLFDHAPGSAYENVATLLTETFQELMRRAATPQDVAEVIHRALTTPRPKARYAVSRGTAALLWARKVLPDRLLDSRLAKAIGLGDLD